MKVTNDPVSMNENLYSILKEYRDLRNFKTLYWIEKKINLINDYFRVNKLSGAVLGVSGGIDSAIALGLLVHAAQKENSPIKMIKPILIPAREYVGATNQDDSISRGLDLCSTFNVKPALFKNLTKISQLISEELESILDLPTSPWTNGQLVAYARTPILYNSSSILTDNGYPSLVIGTINLSEGGYLGYVGKASDGMVDLQIISDLYKSEVYKVAVALGVPNSIINVTPSGDMFDGRSDEEVFGATYDAVELYHLWLQNGSDPSLLIDENFIKIKENLEKLHMYNQHKYTYSSPSIHLDILNAHIPGGWNNKKWRSENGD